MSAIEWTGRTWNPLAGCTWASLGCDNCYAAQMSWRLGKMADADDANGRKSGGKSKYQGTSRKRSGGGYAFNGTIHLDFNQVDAPLSWSSKKEMVFVNSMSDLFHKDVPFDFIDRVFDTMKKTPHKTYQVLTKRPDIMLRYQQSNWGDGFPANVWVGTSGENQAWAENRLEFLLRVHASVHFLSAEPLLGPIDLQEALGRSWYLRSAGLIVDQEKPWLGVLHWVIVGGESGPNARPMHPEWVNSIKSDCEGAGIPFFFKQWGAWAPICEMGDCGSDLYYKTVGRYPHGYPDDMKRKVATVPVGTLHAGSSLFCDLPQNSNEHGAGMLMFKIGKKRSGRLVGGREYSEFPECY